MRTLPYDQAVNSADQIDAAACARRAVQAALDLRDNGGDRRAISGELGRTAEAKEHY